jgi:hypothetical protein
MTVDDYGWLFIGRSPFVSKHFNTISTDPETAAKMPAVLALRDALYTPSFRQFVAEITGVNDLTDRVDCSINAYGTCFRGCAVEREVFGIIVF